MLEIKNVNKFFNKNKKNQIHVINNTSLSFKETGLVALLGPSGCGKTTLLNTIGGLDKIKNGSIYINGEKISSKLSHRVDKIRNINIGYIFQDYKLLDNLSVFDNVALSLKILGIKDKEEIKKRVEYVLDKVGMLRYRRRPASMLSGGERQRVGIARALVKDASVILADEPTGNLDSKNSLEIMKIIKSISKTRLVVLVTHEQDLARFYADRIIEIKDGEVISDKKNKEIDDLDYRLDNTFYLKDFEVTDKIKTENATIDIFKDKKEKINLSVIVKNGNIYVKTENDNKIEVIDDNSNIEIVNEHYKKLNKEEIEAYNFNLKEVMDPKYTKKYSSIFNPITLITNGFKKIFDYSTIKKLLLIGFFASGMFIMYSVSSIASTLDIKEENFVSTNKNYLNVSLKKINIDDYLNYEKEENLNYIIPGNSIVTFKIKYLEYYQTTSAEDELTGSLSSISMINEKDLISGVMPNNDYEIVLDKFTIKRMFRSNAAKNAGILNYEDLLNRETSIGNLKFKIVGIVDKGSPSIYTSEKLFINIIGLGTSKQEEISEESSSILDYNLYQSNMTLTKGSIPINDYEVIVNESNKDLMPLNKTINIKVNDIKLKVVGYYTSKEKQDIYYVSANTYKYYAISKSSDISIYSKDKEATLNKFSSMNLNINDSYLKSKADYKAATQKQNESSLIVSLVILIISFIEIYLMIRSSFLSRIKEVGIYRAIGVKKQDIYKMFFGEIFAITTLGSVPGILFMAYILKTITSIEIVKELILISPLILILSLIFVYAFNLIVGLLPVFNTIRKTPSQILSRHDLD